MASTSSPPQGMVDPAIFELLQAKLDDDVHVREELKNIVQSMEKQGTYSGIATTARTPTEPIPDRIIMSILSRAHSLPQADRGFLLSRADAEPYLISE